MFKKSNCCICNKKKMMHDLYNACHNDHECCLRCLLINNGFCRICERYVTKYQTKDNWRNTNEKYLKKDLKLDDSSYIICDYCKNKIYHNNYGNAINNCASKFINCDHIICDYCYEKYENGYNCLICNDTRITNFFDTLKKDVSIDNEIYRYNNILNEYTNKYNNIVKLIKYNCGHVKVIEYSKFFEFQFKPKFVIDNFKIITQHNSEQYYCPYCTKYRKNVLCAISKNDFKQQYIIKIATRAKKYCDIKIICE